MHHILTSPLLKATWETIYMVFIASFISILCGLVLGVFLFICKQRQTRVNFILHRVLGFIINATRSVPFIILMIAIIPLTRLLVGTTIGTNAAIVPLALAAIPFYARICENALTEVPEGLLEAAQAMGASTWHSVCKVLLPESAPALIRGATLTVIGLIGYSAMAGVVGGGGLGELAINYGYQRFDVSIMIQTVIVLIVMVQLIQILGDYAAQHRQIKLLVGISVILWACCITSQVWPTPTSNAETLRIGVMSGAPEKVMAAAQEVALKKYGLHLEIIPFSDYVQPNTALNNANIDANIFQHVPYLEAQVKTRHYHLTPIARTFVYPLGFYSTKIHQLNELHQDALVAIPNDPSNTSRSLLLLQKAGLIKLKAGVGTLASLNDIVENPLHLRFKLLDSAQLPRSLADTDLAAITNDYIGPSGLTIEQAVLKEDGNSLYANIIVVRTEDKEKPIFKKLIAVMHSQAVLKLTEKLFPHGAAIPAWST